MKTMLLGTLVNKYSLYKMRLWQKEKMSFKGAHNAGNDAVANLKVILSIMFDTGIATEDDRISYKVKFTLMLLIIQS